MRESAIEPADAALAKRLKLKAGTPLVRLDLLRFADRVPICAATTWLDAARFPDAAKVYARSQSITRMLARFGIQGYRRDMTSVTASIADSAEAAPLRIAFGRPLLVVDSVDVDSAGVPLLTTKAHFAADRLELVIEH